jgi:NAD dependent epimerase/dehydratase family enzyme
MADLLLTGQRAVPARALEMGFRFRFERLDDALKDLLSVKSRA